MKEYIKSLEGEFSQILNGFKEEKKRALADFKTRDYAYIKKLDYLTSQSKLYQVRIDGVFLFGYLLEDVEILNFMRPKSLKMKIGEFKKY